MVLGSFGSFWVVPCFSIYRSYLAISLAIFSEIFTSICEIMFKQGGSAYSREFARIFFSQRSKPKEMSCKFQNRLVAKFQ